MIRTKYVILFLALSILRAASGPYAFGNLGNQTETSEQIEIRLTPTRKTIRAGEALEVRVEIQNVGKTELFIEKSIYQPCMYSPLSFYLDNGPPLSPQARAGGCAGDCLDDPKETITNRLAKHWIALPVGHFYGAVVRLDPGFFPELQTSGHWDLRGRYRSGGDLSSSFCVNLNHSTADIEPTEKLPYRAWKGEEDTNTVRIEVVRQRKKPDEKQ
jgi:hypothetical protein